VLAAAVVVLVILTIAKAGWPAVAPFALAGVVVAGSRRLTSLARSVGSVNLRRTAEISSQRALRKDEWHPIANICRRRFRSR
jgi:hypothetical protein